MPYTHAKYYIFFVLIVIVVGFWESYFIPIFDVPFAFHVHAFTALAWVALLLFQDWSIRSKRRKLHKIGGIASLILFPFLILGFTMIINHSAASYVASQNPVAQFLNPSFGLSMFFAIIAYFILYYLALANRQNLKLHAGYMLTTPLVLFESPFSRVLLSYLPFLVFTSSEFPQRILDGIVISMGIAIIFSLFIYSRNPKSGTPFIIAAGLMTVQAVTIYGGTKIEWVREGFALYANIPNEITMLISFISAGAVTWLGWRAGKRPFLANEFKMQKE
jgi:hypothetical protein